MDYQVRAASSDRDLNGILTLQAANLPGAVDAAERREQGFVTLRHNLPLLREMNSPWPHLIATPAASDEVVAYALVMLTPFRDRFADLLPMFEQLDAMARPGGRLEGRRYYIMGQLCVAKAHRGHGLVERLYAAHRTQMSGAFEFMITVIDKTNTRSIRAHEKAGCVVIHEYSGDDGRDWALVCLPLGSDSPSATLRTDVSPGSTRAPA